VLGPGDGGFLIAQWTDPGGSPEPIAPLRVHREDDEAWYVLEGMPGFRVGDHEFEAPAGAPVFGPHGVPHTF
jgi:mannose-6-phosphate isomerase-like protein (cupin superfamily)